MTSTLSLQSTLNCSEKLWTSLVPAVLILAIFLCNVTLPRSRKSGLKSIASVFWPFLSFEEAEALNNNGPPSIEEPANDRRKAPLWLSFTLSLLAFLEVVLWTAISIRRFIRQTEMCSLRGSALMALSWLYASLKPTIALKVTPPYDLLLLYITFEIAGIVNFGNLIQWQLTDPSTSPSGSIIVYHILNFMIVSFLIVVVLTRPVSETHDTAMKDVIPSAPEDRASLWSWLTYGWLHPLIKQGTYNTLNEDDIPTLSITIRAKPVFVKFNSFRQKSLPRQLFMVNSLDLLANLFGSVISVLLNYAGPLFLRKIIRCMEEMTPEKRIEAYVSAFLMFACQIMKAVVDGQHLWFGRRAATRVRSELMSAIYEKALKRKDFSGIVRKGKGKKSGTDSEKPQKGKKVTVKDEEEAGTGADIGKIVGLMSSDVTVIANLISGLNTIYGAPFEIITACVFLYQLLGWSAFIGFAVLGVGWPLNTVLSRRATRINKGTKSARDKRLTVLNELISAIKPIKFFGWEERWIQRVLKAREVEIDWIRKSRINSVLLQALWTTAPILVSIVSFFAYIMRGNELDVATAFTAVTLFAMIKQPLNTIPTWVVQLLRTRVSVRRIETFLNEDEVSEQVSAIKRTQIEPQKFSHTALGFRNASFKWNEAMEKGKSSNVSDIRGVLSETAASSTSASAERKFELQNLDIIFPEGKLSVITGPTASGKTAIILALLGEMSLLPGGEIVLPKEPTMTDEHGLTRSISYAAQTPWLQHLGIKENILFGSPYDEGRYKEVVESCALLPDLEMLEDGDETEIGARGINLSGGQKARVALARAAYARSKYVLLDDPLSAVDSPTALFLYERLLCGPLMENRTVILVTHHLGLVLPHAHYLVRMNNGRIDLQGEIGSLFSTGEIGPISTGVDKPDRVQEYAETGVDPVTPAASEQSTGSALKKGKAKRPTRLVQPESRETGRIRWPIYKAYLQASSYKIWTTLFILTTFIQGMGFIEKFWIKTWGEAYETNASLYHGQWAGAYLPTSSFRQVPVDGQNGDGTHTGAQGLPNILPSADAHPLFGVGVYASIGLITVFLSVLSVSIQFLGSVKASQKLFSELLHSIVHATMRWHDTTPIGRILNRFSKDIETIDASLSTSFRAFYTAAASFVTSMVIVIGVFPPFAFPAVVIGCLYYRVAIGYLNASRHLRRMESTTRSPIFSEFGELLDGIITVRAFSAEERFLNTLHTKVDLTLKMFFYFWMTNRWLLLNFDCLGAIAVLTTTIFALSFHSYESEQWAGWAALCITSAMTFTNRFYWACRYWTRLELDLNSVERVVEYLDIPQEPPGIIENNRPPAYWPSTSGPNSNNLLLVQDLEVRYAPGLSSVLHDVSFSAKAGERIGIVGRTGSGKSTLATSILRFIEPVKGKIIINGIDIASIGIFDLRSRLTFIPQDALLFSGTIRENIDPFEDYSEAECSDALRRVHLIMASPDEVLGEGNQVSCNVTTTQSSDAFSSLSEATLTRSASKASRTSLETEVSAGGVNFSAGQRQLIALARAILRRSSIVILDEATSSIDFVTDTKVQKTIREEFKSSLLLTIAHRLTTVIDYNRLLVLEAGRIVEFDTPHNLLQIDNGVFRDMCLKSGSFSELERLAGNNALVEV